MKKGLVSATSMLQKALKGNYAVGQFNVNNLEWTKIALTVAQEKKSPIILGVSEGAAKYMGGFNTVAKMTEGLIETLNVNVPVVLHLDHGSSFENCKSAIDAGFSSVMFDGSALSIDENIKETKKVVEYASKNKVSVEAEVGTVGGEEDGVVGGISYANKDDCLKLVKATNVNYLAASLGSVHGHYNGKPKLGFKEMEELSNLINIPLVLHGGSGIPDDMIRRAISSGESKINVNTELQERFAKGVSKYIEMGLHTKGKGFDPRKLLAPGVEGIREGIIDRMVVFGSVNKA